VARTEALEDRLGRAAALNDAGHYGAALLQLDRLITFDPSNARAHVARAWALENLGPERLPEARDAYVAAVRLDPSELWAKEGLANVLRRLGQPEEADALCSEVVEEARARDVRDTDLLELLGWCEYRLGRFEDAAASLREALVVDADLLAVRLDLALVLLCAGLHDEALAEYIDGTHRAKRIGEIQGLLGVALDDLEEALTERPELRDTSGALAARQILLRALDAPRRPA
jgi:tetratricopeptide (TPR) repeat protein